ncbi:CLUMA_CG019082, isoform A [Clunio marinus]|uniref:CLUMA_CG019082, isoform A n=1 Tax=Clunio marinus TaxID=568069 RepID=A0A1J1J381_9DIPT|nr:CLUMA_CG019082, isoform A [Clunio marinus]
MDFKYLPCPIKNVQITESNAFDSLVVIEDNGTPKAVADYVVESKKFDKAFSNDVSCFKVNNQTIIFCPLAINDYSDVREYFNAAKKGIERAVKAGYAKPTLLLPSSPRFKNGQLSAILGALAGLYVPIQYREASPANVSRIQHLFVTSADKTDIGEVLKQAIFLGSALQISRDIGGGDPERMAPPRVAEYVEEAFKGGRIKMEVISDQDRIEKDFPLFGAVNRAARAVPRHHGRIIFLEYVPPKPSRKTLMLVGKGVTYDTGGADIKAGGIMAGMSRDKCGAAALAGFMKFVEMASPEDVHVVIALCMVRNSVGEECYVADEILTSRAGVRVRVGNTDAEGRMAMADSLALMKERVVKENLKDPHLYTVATLTGHACLAVGDYTAVMDNKVAENNGHGLNFCKAGDILGDPAEISPLRPEDFTFHRSKAYGEDLLQCNNLPSSRTPRGHQTPAAFLIMASGLDHHDASSTKPIKYTHLDIAGSAGDIPHPPTGAPILALAQLHLM